MSEREKIYRAGNALADWLGLSSWMDIPLMQYPERIADFKLLLERAI